MEIKKKYTDLDKDLQTKMKEGNVFFSEEYSRYGNATGVGVWYVYDDNYILPVFVTERVLIKQGLYVSEPLNIGSANGKRQMAEFLNCASIYLKKAGIARISTSAAALFSVYPDDSQRIPFGSHIIDLSQSEEEIFMNMHSKHRNSVRRAERNGVTVVSGGKELISDYIKADSETWERSERVSYGEEFFEKILDSLGDNAVLYVAYKNDEPQSAACYFKNRKMCYYMYGASITNPEPGATNLLQWVAIKDMKEEGIEKFSFVGCRINEDEDSKYHGIQRFKERFGGELCQGFMFSCDLKPMEYRIFQLLYRLKKGSTLESAIDQEIHKWPELQKVIVEE